MLKRRHVLSGLLGTFGPLIAAAQARSETQRRAPAGAPHDFQLDEVELEVPGLHPAHDGLVLGQLSDIHVGVNTPDGRVIAAVQALNARRPDLVMLTGDYVTRPGDPIDRVPELLAPLTCPHVYAVLGNHDHWTDGPALAQHLARAGFGVLQNENTAVTLRGAPLTVVGIDDAVTGRADARRALRGVPVSFREAATAAGADGASRIVLAHAPPTIDQLPKDAGLVCFSGHTHGGQVYVAGMTEAVFARAKQPYLRGRYAVGTNQVYVNRGLGFGRGGPYVRVNAEPEVSIITLRRAPRSSPSRSTS
jgi:hypothetical protein